MKDIMLKIKGTQIGADDTEDIMEFVTEGKLYEKQGAFYVLYDESEVSGQEGCKTTLKLTDGQLRMNRHGREFGKQTVIEFKKGKRFYGVYNTPFGAFEIEVLTNKLEQNLGEDGRGSINVDYNVCLKGLAEGRNKLDIQIM